MANTVLLLSDEHNPFFSSVYGCRKIHTPNMQRLAQIGTVYQNAYCPSPLCVPSRSAFMTGKRVHTIQTYNNCNIGMRTDHTSFGAVLAAQGVHATYIGKTHVYDKGVNLGFSEMTLPRDATKPHIEIGRNPMMKLTNSAERAKQYGPQDDPWPLDNQWINTAVEWLTTRAQSIDKPWVLVVGLLKPHFPHFTTQELWDMYSEDADLPAFREEEESAQHPYAKDLRNYFEIEKFSEEQIRGLRRGYLGCVTYVDQQLGRLINTLDKTKLSDNTNLIYTSDHGEMLGKFGMWWKCTLYEDSVRVPCIAAGPDFASGGTVSTPVDLFDLQAALFKAVGAKRPSDWVGQPLQSIPDHDAQRVVFSEYHGHGTRAGAYMIRKGDWKYIHYIAAPDQLFNLAADPNELNNFIETHNDIAKDLERELRVICSPERENERTEQFIKRQLALIDSWK